MKLKLKQKIFFIVVSIIIVLSVGIISFTYYEVNVSLDSNVDESLKSNITLALDLIEEKYDGDWKIEGDKLYKGEKLINDDTKFVDEIREKTNAHVTIFLKDTRVSTTVVNEGKRATGTKASEEVVEKVINNKSDYAGKANVVGKQYEVHYMPIKDKSGETLGMFFMGIDSDTINSKIFKIISIIAGITVIMIVLAAIVISKVTKSIVNPLKQAVEFLGLVSTGDLSNDVPEDYLKRYDEIGDLARGVSDMKDKVKGMILTVKNNSENIDVEMEGLSAATEELSTSTENVATAIQDVAKGATDQSEKLMDINNLVDKFSNVVDNMISAVHEIENTSIDVNSKAKNSNEKMKELVDSVEDMKSAFGIFVDKINDLGQEIGKVDEITEVINSIAEQTNLLALNAAIEAARAGESGKGFAVVAEEIRKLAEQSKSSSENINVIIKNVLKETGTIVDVVKEIDKEFNDQENVIKNTVASFKEITESIESVIPKMNSINSLASEVKNDQKVILSDIENIAAISEETSASSEEIAASSEEMNATCEEAAAVAENLSGMTKNMKKEVEKFKL